MVVETLKFADKLSQFEISEFWFQVHKKGLDDCWDFLGATNPNGYGKYRVAGILLTAHRVAYTIANGDIPDNLLVRHKCIKNKICCNPNHLTIGTQLQNIQDAQEAGTLCKGSKCKNSKLKEEDIIEIRKLHWQGFSSRYIAAKYDMGHRGIQDICNYKIWKHVK